MVNVLLDQQYGVAGGAPLRYDLFTPASESPAPLVICIHGGGWISGEKEGMHEVARGLAELGFAAASPQYRLAPLYPCPAAIDDVQAFIDFAHANAATWGADPERIAVLGNSAGGHLACMAGLTRKNVVRAVVDICGITDVTNPREQHFPIAWEFLDQFMGIPWEGNEEFFKQASPLHHVASDSPPFLVVHGDVDDIVPVEQSDALVAALRTRQVPVDYHRLPNEGHALSYGAWEHTFRLVKDFLSQTLNHAVREPIS
ncbi:MAG TPA: alpha/beta hydrolase [Fimbriimonadaceae bacterium]|nr:alpha/beta hydrolase [Fimbriimonadaceae bacterium]